MTVAMMSKPGNEWNKYSQELYEVCDRHLDYKVKSKLARC